MYTRSRNDVEKVEWGGGTSERLLTAKDEMGFAVAHTIVRAGSSSKLQYRNHQEACYCIAGNGSVVEPDGTVAIVPVEIERFATGRVVLRSGVSPGDSVVGEGSQLMFPGRRVVPGKGR